MVMVASISKACNGTLADIVQALTINLTLIIHEFIWSPNIMSYCGFLGIHRGKGLLYLFLGCVIMCDKVYNIIVAILTFTMGFMYIIVSLTSFPAPNGLFTNWQNHKHFSVETSDITPSHHNMIPHHDKWYAPPMTDTHCLPSKKGDMMCSLNMLSY
ncbi:hypothetical protein BDB01DRAFT_835807 [Pilobolus umbonatus]|nr:hypothetical protein BDB01DRAFT_835807 [Pilobolus umbonatus]